MKTIISPEPGKVCLGDIPVPTPGPYEALVKIEACAICNHTDMMFVNREFGGADIRKEYRSTLDMSLQVLLLPLVRNAVTSKLVIVYFVHIPGDIIRVESDLKAV